VLKTGMDTRQVVARIEAERQGEITASPFSQESRKEISQQIPVYSCLPGFVIVILLETLSFPVPAVSMVNPSVITISIELNFSRHRAAEEVPKGGLTNQPLSRRPHHRARGSSNHGRSCRPSHLGQDQCQALGRSAHRYNPSGPRKALQYTLRQD
jgi:hypothetical protein